MSNVQLLVVFLCAGVARPEINVYSDEPKVRVNKCCEIYELFVGGVCTHVNRTNSTIWKPNIRAEHTFITGSPDCGSMQKWPIYHYNTSTDELKLLPNGNLRHYLHRVIPHDESMDDDPSIESISGKGVMYYDYEPGKYCMDKHIEGNLLSEFAFVCAPEQETDWTSTEFMMRNIINPITHGITIVCFLFTATIYFIMAPLRDLVGNIVTTISMCFIVNQAADMARLLTVFTNHISIIITETFCYVSLLGAFFWLNGLAYYIWKTFKSRNVYLRITDGKKYCYYSLYAWSCTIVMGFIAIFAHYTMDYPTQKEQYKLDNENESIGSLGIIIFFMPVAFTVLVNIFLFSTTLKTINRMNTYGRIHHKLRHSFRMFFLLFLVMTLTWIFFLMSFSKFDGLIYCYICVNAIQGPMILYICIFDQKHVSFLIRKNCCYTDCVCTCCQPEEPECDWGDEMSPVNVGSY